MKKSNVSDNVAGSALYHKIGRDTLLGIWQSILDRRYCSFCSKIQVAGGRRTGVALRRLRFRMRRRIKSAILAGCFKVVAFINSIHFSKQFSVSDVHVICLLSFLMLT